MEEPVLTNVKPDESQANRDPLTGATGAHPVGVGLGAVGGGAAIGAAGGAIGGPVGAVIGAAVGAVVGGLVGKGAAEATNPTVEALYWRDQHPLGPYASHVYGYDEYAPAYRYGWESFDRASDKRRPFEEVEADLGRGWARAKGESRLVWDHARHASRDAWNRVQKAFDLKPSDVVK